MIGVARCGLAICLLTGGMAQAAEASYPFEGSWIRADRACTASPLRERTYTAKDVVSPRGRCVIRKIVSAGSSFELFERCERPNERPASVRETIRLQAPDAMILTRQTTRLKLSRSLHFVRCPAPGPAKPNTRPQH